jgi:hypothetical protein
VVVVGIGVGIAVNLPHTTSTGLSSSSGGGAASAPGERSEAAGAGQPSASGPDRLTLSASGTDYRPDTLRAAVPPALAQARPGESEAAAGTDQGVAPRVLGPVPSGVPDALRRLADPAALSACLSAVARTYAGRASAADFARFQGAPALIVTVNDAFGVPGRQWVVVVGPRCGEGGAIADEVYSTRVS